MGSKVRYPHKAEHHSIRNVNLQCCSFYICSLRNRGSRDVLLVDGCISLVPALRSNHIVVVVRGGIGVVKERERSVGIHVATVINGQDLIDIETVNDRSPKIHALACRLER